jgi:hypothetical protein
MPEVQAAQQKHDPELLISFQSSSHLQFTVDVARLFPEMTHHAKRLRGAIPFAYASRTIRLALPGIIRRGLRLFVILVRNNGFRSRYLPRSMFSSMSGGRAFSGGVSTSGVIVTRRAAVEKRANRLWSRAWLR